MNVPDPVSAELMAAIDALSPRLRALVHEYGVKIVLGLMDDCGDDPDDLEPLLAAWRQRRQEEWLRTDYITPRLRRSFEPIE